MISGMVRAVLASRTFGSIKTRKRTRPAAPDRSHQAAGVPASNARPLMPTVAEPPTQEAMIEKPT